MDDTKNIKNSLTQHSKKNIKKEDLSKALRENIKRRIKPKED